MRPEVRELLDKAGRSPKTAEKIFKDGEVDFAGSRAYYAMFYIAEALLLERGLAFSSHSAVIANFGKEFARTGTLNPKFHLQVSAARHALVFFLIFSPTRAANTQ